ncbi:ash family protein [Budvicia diplopodorum]|uniref:ash family protein n=1 Tax=Budvicia diplopodorum TaxID=1119056 RepID=UPI00135684A1
MTNSPTKPLAVYFHPLYRLFAPAKSGDGIDLLNKPYRRHTTRQRLFLCRTFSCTHTMVGWARASQGAPVSDKAGKVNLVQSTTHVIDLSGGGFKHYLSEAAPWLLPQPKHTLQKIPYSLCHLVKTTISPNWLNTANAWSKP